jgi:hypothetical protein
MGTYFHSLILLHGMMCSKVREQLLHSKSFKNVKFRSIFSYPLALKSHCEVVDSLASYSGGPGFKSRPADRLS